MKSQLPVREIFSILIMLVILGSEGQETGVLAEQFKLAGATTDAVSSNIHQSCYQSTKYNYKCVQTCSSSSFIQLPWVCLLNIYQTYVPFY